MKPNLVNRLIIFSTLLLMWGCMNNSVNFQVRFAEVSGLKQDAPVYFEKSEVGNVQKVTYTKQGDYLVEISIAADYKNAATEDSKFYIDNDPKNHQIKTVTIIQERPGGKILENNAIVQGSVKPGFLDEMLSGFKQSATAARFGMQDAVQQMEKSLKTSSQELDQKMTNVLDDLSQQLQSFGAEVKNVPNRQEVQQLKKSIQQFADEFSRAQKDVRDQIRDELIPQLQMELDQLRQQLHNEGRGEEIDEIDKQVKEMSRV